MRKLFLLSLFFFELSAINATHKLEKNTNGQKLYILNDTYSFINYFKDWKIILNQTSYTPIVIQKRYNGDKNVKILENINIGHMESDESLYEYVRSNKKSLIKDLNPKIILESKGKNKHGLDFYYWIIELPTSNVKILQFFYLHSNNSFVINCMSTNENFQKYENLFKQQCLSFKNE